MEGPVPVGKPDVPLLSDGDAFSAFSRASVAMVLTDPAQDDNPIVYVNRAFEAMTGYSAHAAIGRNCRFLQGEETDGAHVTALRKAVEAQREISIDILNYRANGEAFMNRLIISPVHDEAGDLAFFLGIQKDLSKADADRPTAAADRSIAELQHRVKNHLAMIVGLIRLQARETPDSARSDTLARRIESLQLLYEELSRPDRDDHSGVALGAYLGRICSAISHLDGRAGIRVNVSMEPVHVGTETALQLGLILSEVLTNALQHAFPGRGEGCVEVSVTRADGGDLRLTVSDDGVGMPEGQVWPSRESTGGRIVRGLIEGLEGDLDVTRGAAGTVVTLDVPRRALDTD